MSQYTAVAQRSLAMIARKGARGTFQRGVSTYDPRTNTYTGGGTPVSFTGVQIPGDPDRLAALSLVLVNPVTLLVAGAGLAIAPPPNAGPKPGDAMTWAGLGYTVKDVEAIAPDGTTPIVYSVIAEAG